MDAPVVRDDAVLVKVCAAANPYDWHLMKGEPYFMHLLFGLRTPKRNGLVVDFSGKVKAIGTEMRTN